MGFVICGSPIVRVGIYGRLGESGCPCALRCNPECIIIIITNIIVITILQKVRVSFMFRDHYRPNPFLPQLRASYFHPRILFSSFACLWSCLYFNFLIEAMFVFGAQKSTDHSPLAPAPASNCVFFWKKFHLFVFVSRQKNNKTWENNVQFPQNNVQFHRFFVSIIVQLNKMHWKSPFSIPQDAETFKEIQMTAEANTNTNYTKLQNALKVSVLHPG